MLCQEDHVMSLQCVRNTNCKSCGEKGHLRKDCTQGLPVPPSSTTKVTVPFKNSSLEVEAQHFGMFSIETKRVKRAEMEKISRRHPDISITPVTSVVRDDQKYDRSKKLASKEKTSESELNKPIDKETEREHGEYYEQSEIKSEKQSIESESNKHVDHEIECEDGEYFEHSEIKKESKLNAGKYNVVSVHVELLRSNKHNFSKLTQIGCVAHSDADTFFRSIRPCGIENLLDNYKLSGDLLQALHMTREDDGTFLFRKKFDVVETSKNIICVEEKEALRSFIRYLQSYPNCILVGIDEDTVAILMKKLEKMRMVENIVGFSYWKRVLRYSEVKDNAIDLEDYLSKDLCDYKTVLDIAKLLMKSVEEVLIKSNCWMKNTDSRFYTLCKKIDFIRKPKKLKRVKEAVVENFEVYNSFSRHVSAIISAEKLEQIVISSGSDSEPEETTATAEHQESMAAIQSTMAIGTPQYWNLVEIGGRNVAVVCPWRHNNDKAKTIVRFAKIHEHIRRAHSSEPNYLYSSLLCPTCEKAITPIEVFRHMRTCSASAATPAARQAESSSPSRAITRYWVLGKKGRNIHTCVTCPICKGGNQVFIKEFISHLYTHKAKERLGTILLCPKCDQVVRALQLVNHITACPSGPSYEVSDPNFLNLTSTATVTKLTSTTATLKK